MKRFKKSHIKLTQPNDSPVMIKVDLIKKAERKPDGSGWVDSCGNPTVTDQDCTLVIAGPFCGLVKESVGEIFDMCKPVWYVPLKQEVAR